MGIRDPTSSVKTLGITRNQAYRMSYPLSSSRLNSSHPPKHISDFLSSIKMWQVSFANQKLVIKTTVQMHFSLLRYTLRKTTCFNQKNITTLLRNDSISRLPSNSHAPLYETAVFGLGHFFWYAAFSTLDQKSRVRLA